MCASVCGWTKLEVDSALLGLLALLLGLLILLLGLLALLLGLLELFMPQSQTWARVVLVVPAVCGRRLQSDPPVLGLGLSKLDIEPS